MVLAARAKWWRMAALCTAASVLGGLAGYAIGAFLFDAVGRPVLEFHGQTGSFEAFRESYNQWGAWIVGGAGLTPFPYKVITIASGATGLDLGIFMAASVVSRGLRFFLEAWLLWYIGPPVRHFVEKNLGLAFTVFLAALLKPKPIALRGLLWCVANGALPPKAPDGRVSLAVDPALSEGFVAATGYRQVGPLLIRVDMFERFAAELRAADGVDGEDNQRAVDRWQHFHRPPG